MASDNVQDGEFKTCPYCRERIRETAIKCRFCGEWLQTPPPVIESPLTHERVETQSFEPPATAPVSESPADLTPQDQNVASHDPLDEFDTPSPSQIPEATSTSPLDASDSASSESNEINLPPVHDQTETWSDRLVEGMAKTVLSSTEDESAASVPIMPARKGNYFARHWRGDLSLGVSYWGNGFLVTFLFVVVAVVVGVAGQSASLRLVAVLCIAMWLVWLALVVWQIVGTWRSAGHHEARGGKRGWANAARFFLVIGCLNVIGTLWTTVVPQVAEYCRILTGDTSFPAYQVRVLPNGNEVEFRGGLRAGSASELERILKAVPQAKVLRINSIGGRIAEAQKMARVVRERGLSTYTSEYCLSAATLVFIAGKERVVGEGAKLGFHSGSFPGLDAEQLKQVNEEWLQAMRSAGISEWFISQAFSTANADMWYPTVEELRRANVITRESAPVKSIVSTMSALYENSENPAGYQPKSTGNEDMDRVQNCLVAYFKRWNSVFTDLNTDLDTAGEPSVFSEQTLTDIAKIREALRIQSKRQKIVEDYRLKAGKIITDADQEFADMPLSDAAAVEFVRGFRGAVDKTRLQMDELFVARMDAEAARSRFLAFMRDNFQDYRFSESKIVLRTDEQIARYTALGKAVEDSQEHLNDVLLKLVESAESQQDKLKKLAR
jgi:hypothetical protein